MLKFLTLGVLAGSMLLSACGKPAPVAEIIPVPQDREATYSVVAWVREGPRSTVVVKRSTAQGTEVLHREANCATGTVREASQRPPGQSSFMDLTPFVPAQGADNALMQRACKGFQPA